MAERGQTDNQGRMDQESRGSMGNPQQSGMARSRVESSGNGQEDSNGRKTANRGFAAMDPEKQRRIASEGGRAAHRQGVAHEWSRDEAREAGRKGGQIVSQNREHMSEIGRKGGQSSGQRRQRSTDERGEM
ncbi:MAG: KGG domain-containing protein [Bacteroidota bacterium]|nr:KGG domain-containing protein [Bacteroidota bacterium]